VFEKHLPDNLIHFVGLKVIAESFEYPLKYYQNKVVASIKLLETIPKAG